MSDVSLLNKLVSRELSAIDGAAIDIESPLVFTMGEVYSSELIADCESVADVCCVVCPGSSMNASRADNSPVD